MLSRVADAFYWTGRYLERAEHTARLVDVNTYLSLDSTPESSGRHWHRVFDSLQATMVDGGTNDVVGLVHQLALDRGNKESVASSIHSARENLRQIREQISADLWERINRLYWSVRRTAEDAGWQDQPHQFLRGVIEDCHQFIGLTTATMNRGEGYYFLELGRFLERALTYSALLDTHVAAFPDLRAGEVPPEVVAEWTALLRSCTALEAYTRRFTARMDARRIADFLLLDPEFPRSIRFAVEQVEAALRGITRLSGRENAGRPERLAGRLRASLHYAQLDEIVDDNLQTFLNGISRQCGEIHAATYRTFIGYHLDAALV
jgi:uncharacterized alpha-E superfamily protein